MQIEQALDLDDKVDGIAETNKEAFAFGPGCKWKHFYQIPVNPSEIVTLHSRWSSTQLAAITAEKCPSVSLRKIARDFGIDVAGVSRALKAKLHPCPLCGTLLRPFS